MTVTIFYAYSVKRLRLMLTSSNVMGWSVWSTNQPSWWILHVRDLRSSPAFPKNYDFVLGLLDKFPVTSEGLNLYFHSLIIKLISARG